MNRAIVLLLLVHAATPLVAQQPVRQPDFRQFDAYVTQAVRDWRIPGLAIAIVKDDSVVFAKGYGVRELGKPDRVGTGTRFAIGSTTKAMTAAALAMLVDEGKVAWDAPVTRYLPSFRVADPYVTSALTVRDLLTHRGGLGNADMLWAGSDYSTDEIIRRVATIQPAYSIRSRFIYQNIMYAVAGQVVAAASGMSWAEFVRTRIWQPLGMSATEPTLAALRGKPDVATPHMAIRDSIRPVENRPVDAVAPAGSVWSSVGDMAKWLRFMLDSGQVGGRRLLSARAYREILSPQVIAPRDMYFTLSLVQPHFFEYGLGWFLQDYAGEPVAMHTGSIDGMSAIIGLMPERRLGVYVLANLDHAELRHALMYRVFDLYRGAAPRDWSRLILKQRDSLQALAAAALKKRENERLTNTRPSLALDRYVGTYRNATYGDAVITLQANALHFRFGQARAADLTHWQNDTFQAHWADVRLEPTLIEFRADTAAGVSALRAFGITFQRAFVPAAGTPTDSLLEHTAAALNGLAAHSSIYARHLASGREIAVRADVPMNTLSVIKIAVMIQAFRDADAGRLKLSDRYTVTADDLRRGSGLLQTFTPPFAVTWRDLITQMIITSDNSATDILIKKVGQARVNELLASLGYRETRLRGTTGDLFRGVWILADPKYATLTDREVFERGFPRDSMAAARSFAFEGDSTKWLGRSTARETVRLLEQLNNGELAAKPSTAEMLSILRRQFYSSRLPQRIGSRASIAHKTGDWPPYAGNDVGILFYPGGPTVVAVYTNQNRGSFFDLEATIGRIAEEIVETWK